MININKDSAWENFLKTITTDIANYRASVDEADETDHDNTSCLPFFVRNGVRRVREAYREEKRIISVIYDPTDISKAEIVNNNIGDGAALIYDYMALSQAIANGANKLIEGGIDVQEVTLGILDVLDSYASGPIDECQFLECDFDED